MKRVFNGYINTIFASKITLKKKKKIFLFVHKQKQRDVSCSYNIWLLLSKIKIILKFVFWFVIIKQKKGQV